jgi:hypothetical protein
VSRYGDVAVFFRRQKFVQRQVEEEKVVSDVCHIANENVNSRKLNNSITV